MTIHRVLTGLLLALSFPVFSQKQFGLGVYSGAGFRSRTDVSWKYKNRYGWESGASLQFRRKGGKTIHEWNAGLNGSYFDYTTPLSPYTPPYYYHYTVRMFALDIAYRFHLRVLHRDKLDLYIGAGPNSAIVFLYRDKYEKHEEGIGITTVKKWGSEPQYHDALFGVNGGLSLQYRLDDHWRLSMEANTCVNTEFSLTSASTYTGQNLRFSLLYLFPERDL
jgi:hypothetical protein